MKAMIRKISFIAKEVFIQPLAGLKLLFWLSLISIAAWQLRLWLLLPPVALAQQALVMDDAYFYSFLAKNFLRLGFLTMDGEMPTNGVQPLWLLIQIGLNYIGPGVDSAQWLAWSSLTMYLLVVALAGCYLWRHQPGLTGWWCLAAVLLNGVFQNLAVKGLETSLALACLLATVCVVDAAQHGRQTIGTMSRTWRVGLAVAAAACFYARLDLFWVALVIGAWLGWQERRWQPVIHFGLLMAALVLPYLVYNHIGHGGIVPISSQVKQYHLQQYLLAGNDYWRSDEWQGLFAAFAVLIPGMAKLALIWRMVFTLAVFGGLQFWIWYPRKRTVFPVSLKLLSVVVLLHALFMTLVYREVRPYTAYYFAPEMIWAMLTLAIGINQAAAPRWSKRFWLATAAGSAVALGSIAVLVLGWQGAAKDKAYWFTRVEMAQKLPAIVAQDPGRVAAFWPGAFAQFSGIGITPLDGIIGSQEYFENYLKPGREMQYCLEKNIRYCLTFMPGTPDEVFARPEKYSRNWPLLGIRRLAAIRSQVRVKDRVILDTPTGAGWYLFELNPAP